MAPSYFKAQSDQHMAELLVSVAKEVSETAFYLYYIPFMNNTRHNVCRVLEIANKLSSNVVGCKFTDGDILDFSNCTQRGFNMLGGGDDILV